jgi:hypothetical protein
MAIEAPLSKHRRTYLIIRIVVCVLFAIWFGYDGYFNEKFKSEHVDADGAPDGTLVFNQKAPPVLFCVAVLLGVHLYVVRNSRVRAEENELLINATEKIPYDSIEKIDKTHFKSKGFFVLTYRGGNGRVVKRKLGDADYDNLGPILDELVAKIT